ncbi:MAG: hypothetical protein KGJ88_01605 [Verrucomicrobiota bacterium]|nr:hypothetical protein [Verrucomicrobiota bacterium]
MKTSVYSHRLVSRILSFFSVVAFAALPVKAEQMVSTERMASQMGQFLKAEITAHLAAVTNINPPQATVLGAPTAGDFSWGSFMRALSAVSALTGETNIGGRNIAQFVGQLGLIEARGGGKTFAQLGSALTLRHYGMDLKTNALWQSLSPSDRKEWRSLLNPARFYDFKKHHVIDLPENYMGVASRIITMDIQFGLVTNLDVANGILEHAAAQFLHGARYTDDNMPVGRYDRYSQEYARFVYLAAGNIGRADIQAADAPALKAVMGTWWALVDTNGYGYPWGRTIGDISYMDTMDIIGFLADHPQFRPAPLKDLASVYFAAWHSLLRDYHGHLLNMFGFGRGNYDYMTVAREWQQTMDFFYKSAESLQHLASAMRAEHVTEFPATPDLPNVARFDFFRKNDGEGGREAGAWLVRRGALHFTLPFTTGIRPAISDYLPAPHGLPGFAAPVEQMAPVLTPFLTLADGRTLAAADDADQIIPAKDGLGVTAIWHRFAQIIAVPPGARTNADLPFGQPEQFANVGLTSRVTWKLNGDTLIRAERLSATNTIVIRLFSVIFPSTANHVWTTCNRGRRADTFSGSDATLEVSAAARGVKFNESLEATGNSAMGRGTLRPIPLILHITAGNILVKPGKPFEWMIRIQSLSAK